jgi:hypothetical protein
MVLQLNPVRSSLFKLKGYRKRNMEHLTNYFALESFVNLDSGKWTLIFFYAMGIRNYLKRFYFAGGEME